MNFDMRIARAFLLTSLCSSFCFGQELKFTTKFYDAVDKWVAFNKEEATQIFSSVERSIAHHKKEDFKDDSPYIVGFIYIDQMAGFTFRFEAFVTKTKNGLEKRTEVPDAMLIMRLNKNTYDVAVLSDKEIAQLGLPKEHSLLESYGKWAGTDLYFVKLGLYHNSVGESHKAIEPLLKVYNKNPHFNGLEFELAYAYNATRNFEKAIEVSTKAIGNNPKNYLFYRELGFSFLNQTRLDDAEKAYLKGIELSTVKAQQAEMAHNMAYGYFKNYNKPKFEEWAKLTRKYAEKDSDFYRRIDSMEKNWPK